MYHQLSICLCEVHRKIKTQIHQEPFSVIHENAYSKNLQKFPGKIEKQVDTVQKIKFSVKDFYSKCEQPAVFSTHSENVKKSSGF